MLIEPTVKQIFNLNELCTCKIGCFDKQSYTCQRLIINYIFLCFRVTSKNFYFKIQEIKAEGYSVYLIYFVSIDTQIRTEEYNSFIDIANIHIYKATYQLFLRQWNGGVGEKLVLPIYSTRFP
jgi:hypothetical protein